MTEGYILEGYSAFHEPLFRRILKDSPFNKAKLLSLINTAPFRYKYHYMEKRGGRGLREIAEPAKEVKFLQRLLVEKELHELPLHSAAVAYRRGGSIFQHAHLHAAGKYLLKLDFKNFFHSLNEKCIRRCFHRDTKYSEGELCILLDILCCKAKDRGIFLRHLAVGAPSSPHVSNYVLHEFDESLTNFCQQHEVRYTRYADDMAFSTDVPKILYQVERKVRHLLMDMDYLGLSINEEKTVNISRKMRRTLVGLVLSNEGNVSIGREAKRDIRSQMHRYSKGILPGAEVEHLRGQLAFILSIDPAFVNNLLGKYKIRSVSSVDDSLEMPF